MAEPGHARTKWAGQLETRGYFSRVRSLCAQCGCVNHRIFNGRPSLRESIPVPLTQNIMSTCIIILRTGGCIWAFRRIVPLATKIVWGIAPPPQVKYCGGACPPSPPLPPPMALVTYTRTHARSHTYPRSAHAQTLQIRAEHPPFTNPGYATDGYT